MARRSWMLAAIAVVSCYFAGHAQSNTTGGLEGIIMDAQGRVVPGVRVVARSGGTGKERSTTSNAKGSFQIADLDPDTYAVDVSAASFAPWRAPSVAIEVGRITTLAPHLAVAGHSETVLVRSETPGLETSSAAITTNLSNTTLENLPSNGRRWSNFG